MASWTPAGRSWAYGFRCSGAYDWYVPLNWKCSTLMDVARGDTKSSCRGATDHDSNSVDWYQYGIYLPGEDAL